MIDFDAKARKWDADPVKLERARAIAGAIRARVPLTPGMRALEYGCGTGEVSFSLHPYLAEITLADSSPGMLEVLGEKLAASGVRNMHPRALDLTDGSLPEERYDLIYTAMTLHHIADTERILWHFHRLLNAPGFLCVADLDREDGSFHGLGFSGHWGFDREALAAQAAGAGFTEISFVTIFELPKDVNGEERRYPVFLMTAGKK